MTDNAAADNAEYGLARFDSIGGVVRYNTVTGGGEAGIYLGDSADAGAKVQHNVVSKAQFGIFVRHSSGIEVKNNQAYGNCQGILVLDDGETGGVSNITVENNVVSSNNEACPATHDGPALQGGGILLLGATDSEVSWNIVRNNQGTEVNSGGILRSLGDPVRRSGRPVERLGARQLFLREPAGRPFMGRHRFGQHVHGQSLRDECSQRELLTGSREVAARCSPPPLVGREGSRTGRYRSRPSCAIKLAGVHAPPIHDYSRRSSSRRIRSTRRIPRFRSASTPELGGVLHRTRVCLRLDRFGIWATRASSGFSEETRPASTKQPRGTGAPYPAILRRSTHGRRSNRVSITSSRLVARVSLLMPPGSRVNPLKP